MSMMANVCLNLAMVQMIQNQQKAQQKKAANAKQQENTVAVNQQQETKGITEYDFISKVDEDFEQQDISSEKEMTEEEVFEAELKQLEERYEKAIKVETAGIKTLASHQSFDLSLVNSSMAAQLGIWSTQVQKAKLSSLTSSVVNTKKILNAEKTLLEEQVAKQEKKQATVNAEVEPLKADFNEKLDSFLQKFQTFASENSEVADFIKEAQEKAQENSEFSLEEYLAEKFSTISFPEELKNIVDELKTSYEKLADKAQELAVIEENIAAMKGNVEIIDNRLADQDKLVQYVKNENKAISCSLAYLNLSKIQLQQKESAAKKKKKNWYKDPKSLAVNIATFVTGNYSLNPLITSLVGKGITKAGKEIGGFIDKRLGLESLGKQIESAASYYTGYVQLRPSVLSCDKEAIEDNAKLMAKNIVSVAGLELPFLVPVILPAITAAIVAPAGEALSTASTAFSAAMTDFTGTSMVVSGAGVVGSEIASETVMRKTDSKLLSTVAGYAGGLVGGSLATSGIDKVNPITQIKADVVAEFGSCFNPNNTMFTIQQEIPQEVNIKDLNLEALK